MPESPEMFQPEVNDQATPTHPSDTEEGSALRPPALVRPGELPKGFGQGSLDRIAAGKATAASSHHDLFED
jgi:hypothetical protein